MTDKQPGRYADVNGLHMYYEIHGTGEPVVLVHGAASTIDSTFGRIIPALARRYQVIGVELQAHGRTDNRDGRQISFEQDADDVAALLRLLGVKQACIFGFSNGGTTALQMAIRHPALVGKLIIASSMYKRAGVFDAFWAGFDNADFGQMPDAYKQEFLRVNPDERALHIMFDQCVGRMKAFSDIPDEVIGGIAVPSLILQGDRDVPFPEHAVEMSRRLRDARLGIFPGGHGGYIGELNEAAAAHHPPVALPVIEDFLGD